MLRDKLHYVGRFLSLALLAGVIAILVTSFIKYRNKRVETPPVPRGPKTLGEEVVSITEGYEFVRSENGKLKFKVIAAKDTSYTSGKHELEKLELIGFDDAGKENGRIKADTGESQLDKNLVSFAGHVLATNAEGLEVATESLKYNTQDEIATTPVAINFKRERLTGSTETPRNTSKDITAKTQKKAAQEKTAQAQTSGF